MSKCFECEYHNKIQILKDNKLIYRDKSVMCDNANKAWEIIDKTGKSQILFPMVIDINKNRCEFFKKEIK